MEFKIIALVRPSSSSHPHQPKLNQSILLKRSQWVSDLVRKGVGKKTGKFPRLLTLRGLGGISSAIRGVVVSPYGPDRKQM